MHGELKKAQNEKRLLEEKLRNTAADLHLSN